MEEETALPRCLPVDSGLSDAEISKRVEGGTPPCSAEEYLQRVRYVVGFGSRVIRETC